MSEISGVSSSSSIYTQLSSGKRINSAADDAAGLTIAEKMNSQETGLTVGIDNAKDGVGLLNIADGALGQIGDNLQRIYELGVKASSGLNTGEELGAIQSEVDQLLSDIEGIAKGTEFNTMKILDGSMADIDLATKPDGTGQKIQMVSSTLADLGIEGFNVTGKFNLTRITDAISAFTMLSSTRRIRRPSRLTLSFSSRTSGVSSSMDSRSRFTVNSDPSPRTLFTEMVPFIISTTFAVMARPSPVPCTRLMVVFCSRVKLSKICGR